MKIHKIEELLAAKEGEGLEFKTAKDSYAFEKLAKYLCALSNSGGGKIVFGITDKRPRNITGSNAFAQPEQVRRDLMNQLQIGVDFQLFQVEGKRVLVFEAAARPIGMTVHYGDVAWTRRGEELIGMDPEAQRHIFQESGHDFSADVCNGAVWEDLDESAIEIFRGYWAKKSANPALGNRTQRQLLQDCEVVDVKGQITYAALILFGTHEALGRHLGNSEVVFEYRAKKSAGPAQKREEFRQGFFLFCERLWKVINLRNEKQHYQDGLFVFDVPMFHERIVREAILNAVCHRNYQLPGSVFVRQYQDRLVVESPGGFPYGVTKQNVLNRQSPRNRRIADVLLKSGFVERSGQGMNLMVELSIQQAKALPSFDESDDYQVCLTLDGLMRDTDLLLFMGKIGQETLESFSTEDFLLIDAIHRELKISSDWRGGIPRLVDLGVIERVARGKFILGRRFYVMNKKQGVYTRKKGLDRETQKALLLMHIRENSSSGTRLKELYDVLPGLVRSQLQVLIRELVRDGQVRKEGNTSAARWFVPVAIVVFQLARFVAGTDGLF